MKPIQCAYIFDFLAVNITLIDIFLCTLLHLAGYFFNLYLEEKFVKKQFTGLSNKGSSVNIGESRQVVEHYQ
jgi:hypothetical protein